AARFAVSGVNLGLFCSTPSVPLIRNVARKPAFEMLVTGDFIDAAQAQARGLVNRVVEPEHLDAEIETLAASIVAKPRAVVAMGKELFYRQGELGLEADRKSTRLNSSHLVISYAVFCLKKKK